MAYDAHRPPSDYPDNAQRDTANTSPYPPYDPSTTAFPDPRYYQQPFSPVPSAEPSRPSQYDNVQSPSFSRYDAPSPSKYEGQPPPLPNDAPLPKYNGQPPPPPPDAPRSAQPLVNAINHAFDTSAAANQLPSEVITQITEQVRTQVIDSLRAELAAAGHGKTQEPAHGGATYNQQNATRSPPPYPATNEPTINMPTPHFPPPPSQPFSSGPGVAGVNMQGGSNAGLYGSSAGNQTTSVPLRPVYTPPSPTRRMSGGSDDRASFDGNGQKGMNGDMPTRSKADSSRTARCDSAVKEDLTERYGERTRDAISGNGTDRPAAGRSKTDDEETVVEKMWRSLFDCDGKPTMRLSQFLRGIALHLVEEFEPKFSLVIGPRKMRKFYETMKISDEPYPWTAIFALPKTQLSALYSSLSCKHHLIPPSSSPYDTPTLPALTPQGFATWMTLFIQANPAKEFERLAGTVRDWPVCNADDRKERWPKELSRRLFPKSGGEMENRRIIEALSRVGVPVASTFPPPPSSGQPQPTRQGHGSTSSNYPNHPPSNPSTSIPQAQGSSSFSRASGHRGSYVPPPPPPVSKAHQRNVDETFDTSSSEDDAKPSIRLERERKPYVAREGGGKIHKEHFDRNSTQPTGPANASRDPAPPNTSSAAPIRARERTSSNAADNTPYSSSAPSRTYPSKRGTRGRSPPYNAGQGYGRGSGDIEGSAPAAGAAAAYYSSSATTSARDSYASGSGPPYTSGSAADDERYREYMAERDRREREVRFDEDYRKGGSYSGGGAGLGTGERRYG